MPLTLSFDIGYASIGWCVLSAEHPASSNPDILGTGVVTFPTDDCLVSNRRDLRRTRRHTRSTRQRIERLKLWLEHKGALDREALDRPGHAAPFLLAAAALHGHRTLNAWELWTVLRWYAHNRGYDGNSRWMKGEENQENTEKEQHAQNLMRTYGTSFMCDTVCACMGLNPQEHAQKISSFLAYKTLNAAYPRSIVTKDISQILSSHMGQVPGFDSETVRLILKNSELTEEEREHLATIGIKLPKRYFGGLLFGQLLPRFDNRIIARCPITWAKTYDEAIHEGKNDIEARKLADKLAKVPTAKSKEFLQYRFARILANLKANGNPLDKELRKQLWQLAEKQGRLTSNDLEKAIKQHYGEVQTNIEAFFKIHPDSEESLVIDPVMDEVRKAEGSRANLAKFWKLLPDSSKTKIIHFWQKEKSVSLAWMLHETKNTNTEEALLDLLKKEFDLLKPGKGKPQFTDFNSYLLKTSFSAKFPSGRAPYARPVLKQVVSEILDGFDSTKASKKNDFQKGEDKPDNGVLYDLGIPHSRVRQLQDERPLDKLTNNHLVRHRMLILNRLLDDIIAEFVPDQNAVSRIIVEVAREVSKFSGMTAKEIASEMNNRLKDFKSAVSYLEKDAPNLRLNGSIIRKCRIAMDMNWQCPFTGDKYDPYDLQKLEREHIIPYATRNTNALHALVLTWPEINRMKGKRTARQFVIDCGNQQIPGKENLSIFNLRQFEAFVDRLDTKGHPDDARRKRERKALLNTTSFEDKELGFTDGALTKTSHLMKLAMRGLTNRFPGASCDPIPGPITAEIRKSWRLTGTLAFACPEIIDPHSGEVLPKNEIRGLTHMHHALDAATLALTAHYFPLKIRGVDQSGIIWQALLKRYRTQEEKDTLFKLGIFDRYQRTRTNREGKETIENDVRLRDLLPEIKQKVAFSLAQCRVAQHVPADQSGAKAERTTWGVVSSQGTGDEARISLRQQTSTVENGVRKKEIKKREERVGKLLGISPKNGSGKLKNINGAIIIEENYGLALDPKPTVIPFQNVAARLKELKTANGGKSVRVLRKGMSINLTNQKHRNGIWTISTVQASLKIDLLRPGIYGRPKKGDQVWREVPVSGLLKKGMEILPQCYTGHPKISES